MTQAEVSQEIVRQLRLLDPSISAEVGTPERKIIDVVAQQIAERSIDLNQLRGALDIDSKYGTDLDNLLSIFRFGRQQGSFASSFVTFSRNTPSNYDIFIPSGTVVVANASGAQDYEAIWFRTTASAVLPSGQLSVIAPVTATRVGAVGNVSIGEITGFGSEPIAGISDVTNEVVGKGGVDPETDDELKARFKNTVFRNVSGTHDQFLANALQIQSTTKANVVGPISKYIENIKVPDNPDSQDGSGSNSPSEWTSALSAVPYSKHVYKTLPHYVIDSQTSSPYFFRQDIDYVMNTEVWEKNKGDSYRQKSILDPLGQPIQASLHKPNVTFKSVLPPDTSRDVYGLRPGQVVQFEHSYMSTASRNDYAHGVLNCVDVFINGENEEFADVVMPLPSPSDAFINNPASIRYYNNYRRYGEPTHVPMLGNLFQPLFFQPTMRLPDTISVGDNLFIKDIHYYEVEDVTELRGTTRARNGIEWNPLMPGKLTSDPISGPFTGSSIATLSRIENFLESENRNLVINNYSYNKSIQELQIVLESNKQVTTDVLGHAAKMRYFKVDVAIIYALGVSESNVNANITRALAEYFNLLYFGSYIQLSDILLAIKQVAGVDSARWSIDALREDPNFQGNWKEPVDSQGRSRWPITECDSQGRPLTRVVTERVRQNYAFEVERYSADKEYPPLSKVQTEDGRFWISINAVQGLTPGESSVWREALPEGTTCIDRAYLTGNPRGGSFILSYKLFNAGLVEYADSPNSITGYGPPNDDIGNVGDLYYDKENQRLYSPKTQLGWGDNEPYSLYKAVDMVLPYNATASDVEQKLREQQGDFAEELPKQTLKVTGLGTPSDPWIIEWLKVIPFAEGKVAITILNATGGTFSVSTASGQTTGPIAYDAPAANIKAALVFMGAGSDISVEKIGTTYVISSGGPDNLQLTVDGSDLTGEEGNPPSAALTTTAGGGTAFIEPLYGASNLWGDYSWDKDFALKDDELPAIPSGMSNLDTGAGFIVSVKTQNTWNQG